jgi:two-component system chemotaxis sensor kinase CheA
MSEQNGILKKLLVTFGTEAEEHLRAISSGLVELEKAPPAQEQATIVETVYREAHSLKGAARAVNLTDIEAVCQSLEGVFARFKTGGVQICPELFDTLHKAVDAIGRLVVAPGEKQATRISALLKDLDNLEAGTQAPRADSPPAGSGEMTPSAPMEPSGPEDTAEEEGRGPPAPAGPQSEQTARREGQPVEAKPVSLRTVRIPTDRLDSSLDAWKEEWARVQHETRTARQILDKNNGTGQRNKLSPTVGALLKFLEWNRACVERLDGDLATLAESADTDARLLDRMVGNLLEDMKRVLMLPFLSLLEGFPKMVRDLSRDSGKEISLDIRGAEVEIDKRILEEMKDPLTHLLRNCVDHGIEKPEQREALDKPRRGNIAVAVSQIDSETVEVLISDDGAGIDLGNVKNAAVKAGILSEGEARDLDEQQALSLIYYSGVSTSAIITDVSGRGLGLAITKEKLEKLGGTMSIETQPDAGTSFRILLPLSLSAFRGVLVRAGGQTFVVPTMVSCSSLGGTALTGTRRSRPWSS